MFCSIKVDHDMPCGFDYLCPPPLLKQVFDNYAVTVMIGGEPYTLGLFDTAGMYLPDDIRKQRVGLHPPFHMVLCVFA